MSDDTRDDAIAKAIQALATGVKYLGNGDAASTMGAIEFLATKIDKASERIASAVSELAASNKAIAEAIAEGMGVPHSSGPSQPLWPHDGSSDGITE